MRSILSYGKDLKEVFNERLEDFVKEKKSIQNYLVIGFAGTGLIIIAVVIILALINIFTSPRFVILKDILLGIFTFIVAPTIIIALGYYMFEKFMLRKYKPKDVFEKI